MRARDLRGVPLAERVAIEERLWDKVRDETFADRSLLQLTHPSYESLFTAYPEYRHIHEFFGPSVAGRHVLEVGCGSGVVSVALANSGARVTAVDVSTSALRVTRERADVLRRRRSGDHGPAARRSCLELPHAASICSSRRAWCTT